MNTTHKVILGVTSCLLLICLCVSIVCLGAAGFAIYSTGAQSTTPTEDFPPPTFDPLPLPTLETPDSLTPTPAPTKPVSKQATPSQPAVTPPPFKAGALPDSAAVDTLKTLMSNIIPENDPVLLAQQYKGVGPIEPTVPPPPQPYKVGDKTKFWMSNSDTQEYRQVSATLRYATPHLYFWVEDSAKYNQSAVKKLCDTFENSIYPTDRKFFGSEWSPGIDGEIPLYVLYAKDLGKGIAGFFSSIDEIPPAASKYSNGHEMFVISADVTPLTRSYDYGTFAHEFQHMIHFNTDRNEESWVNEGFSELAQLLNKYDAGNSDKIFLSKPDLQLNTWEAHIDQNRPHYGASFLFMTYFLGRFGEQATQALVANKDNGLDSIDAVLKQLNLKSAAGQQLSADDVFADWTIANILSDKKLANGLYDYPLYKAPKAQPSETLDTCPFNGEQRTVHQYGTQYLALTCQGTHTLEFEGAPEVRLLPADPHSGNFAFWSGRGDESSMTLTHEFDLTGVTGPVSVNYSAWFDIEENYDYTFLAASEDGKTWKTLKLPSGTDKNPGGANMGWGYTGASNGWLQEEVDLSAYAGKKIQLRFEYLTDPAVNQNGFFLDDVSIPALNYQTDFEKDDGGWQTAGFARIANRLPQTFRVSLVKTGAANSVEPLVLDASQHGSAQITIQGDEQVILVVSGTTRFTTQTADFQFSVR